MNAECRITEQWFWDQVIGSDYLHCWLWNGSRSTNGYGRIVYGKRRRTMRAHRWAYETTRGEIPADLVLDHLCRHKLCVNPWHLEPVSLRENVARGLIGALNSRPQCDFGHDFTVHGRTYANGQRKCRLCGIAKCWLYRHTPIQVQESRRAAGLNRIDLAAYFAGLPQAALPDA